MCIFVMSILTLFKKVVKTKVRAKVGAVYNFLNLQIIINKVLKSTVGIPTLLGGLNETYT